MKSHILTVTQFTSRVKSLLENSFPDVWVEGEISNLSTPQSGHAYFTLKDEQSQVRAVLFRASSRFLKFSLEQGMHVVCRGRIGLYEPRGEYQLILEYLEPKGVGALQRAFEQLKARLEGEGLFASEHKKKLPLLPRRIALITSPTGAAIRDMLRVIRRRHPRMHILVYPVPVQGADAAPALIEGIRYFNREGRADVLIIGRGGGSLEDLWAFNEEGLARAIYESRIPIISAVGHETDYTIADFVSDVRAPTPSAAAEMVVQTEESFCEHIASLDQGLAREMRRTLERARSSSQQLIRLLADPRRLLERHAVRVDELTGRLATGLRQHVRRDRARLNTLTGAISHLNPLAILSRGYSMTKKIPAEALLRSVSHVSVGDTIRTVLHEGSLLSRVEKIES